MHCYNFAHWSYNWRAPYFCYCWVVNMPAYMAIMASTLSSFLACIPHCVPCSSILYQWQVSYPKKEKDIKIKTHGLHHIMPLVIRHLGAGHTHTRTHIHTHTHTDTLIILISRNQAHSGLWPALSWFKVYNIAYPIYA